MAAVSREEARNKFTYHKPDQKGIDAIEAVRKACADLAVVIVDNVPYGREQSLAFTKLEEVSMWANKAIAFASGPTVDKNGQESFASAMSTGSEQYGRLVWIAPDNTLCKRSGCYNKATIQFIDSLTSFSEACNDPAHGPQPLW